MKRFILFYSEINMILTKFKQKRNEKDRNETTRKINMLELFLILLSKFSIGIR